MVMIHRERCGRTSCRWIFVWRISEKAHPEPVHTDSRGRTEQTTGCPSSALERFFSDDDIAIITGAEFFDFFDALNRYDRCRAPPLTTCG